MVIAAAAVTAAQLTQHNGGRPGLAPSQLVLRLPLAPRLSPVAYGKHDRIILTMIAHRSAGVFGKTLRQYLVAANASHPRVACVNNREGSFTYSVAGIRVRAVLDPAKGDGGPQGWCPGLYHGTVSYVQGFNCGAIQGPCNVPAPRAQIIARFDYRVR